MSSNYDGTAEEKLALSTYVKFVRALDTVRARIDAKDTVGDLHGAQFGTLEMLYHLGAVNQKQIGAKLLMSKSNMVSVIDKLEKKGLVRRERSMEDRRCVLVHLTEAGEQLIQQLLPVHVAAITEEMNYLTADEQKEFGRLCRKLGLGK